MSSVCSSAHRVEQRAAMARRTRCFLELSSCRCSAEEPANQRAEAKGGVVGARAFGSLSAFTSAHAEGGWGARRLFHGEC